MADLSLAFDILGKDKASPAFKSAGNSAEGFRSKLGGIAKAGKIVGTAIAGVAIPAIVGLGAAMATGIKDAVNYQTLQLKTEAVLKSTGNVANTSVKQIQTLAGSLESLSGVDEELIINSQNVLATFTKVRNEMGKGNKIFDRATKSALNMSVALGQDMQSATVMLGKALNDPVKGITAMTRAGVQFTEQQEDQIKWLVENGRLLDAQKIILKELETQFGGTAEAAGKGLAGDLARLKDVFGDTFREIGEQVLPMLSDLAEWFSERLPGAIESVKGFVSSLREPFDTAKTAIGGLVSEALDRLSGWWSRNGEAIKTWFSDVGSALSTAAADGFDALSNWWANNGDNVLAWFTNVGSVLNDDVAPALKATGGFLKDTVLPALSDFASWVVDNEFVFETLKTLILGAGAAWIVYSASAAAAAAATAAAISPAVALLAVLTAIIVAADKVFSPKLGPGGEGLLDFLGPFDPTKGAGFLKGVIPGFATGGMVPGPIGMPRLAVVHGGEEVRTPEQQVAGRASQTNTYIINNPVPEPVSTTVQHLKRLAADRAS